MLDLPEALGVDLAWPGADFGFEAELEACGFEEPELLGGWLPPSGFFAKNKK